MSQPDKKPEPYISQTGRERCAVEGTRVGGEHAGLCTVVALRGRDGVELYPHGDGGLRVDLDPAAAVVLGRFLTREDTP